MPSHKKEVRFTDDVKDTPARPSRTSKHSEYPKKHLQFLDHCKASLKLKMYRALEEELNTYTPKIKALILSVCDNALLKWAASRGNIKAMKFIIEQMPESAKSQFMTACSGRDAAVKKFIAFCVNADLSNPETVALLNEGLQILAAIAPETTAADVSTIAQEYAEDIQLVLLSAAGAITPHTEATHDVSAPSAAASAALYAVAASGAAIFMSGGPHFDPEDFGDGGVLLGGSSGPNSTGLLGIDDGNYTDTHMS